MSFNSLKGNDKVKETLKETIKSNKILHSYLFVGQEGVGKSLFAKEFAKMILCKNKDTNENDNCDCESCSKYKTNNHPDFMILNSEDNSIKIAQIRKLIEDIYQKPIVSEKKVYIINDCNKMTVEAQNSLLKTLEEPPKYIVIILISSNESMLLNTIKSRCSKIQFENIPEEEIIQYIRENDNEEIKNIKLSEDILKMSNGSIGRLLKVTKNIEEYNKVEIFMNSFLNKKIKSKIDFIKEANILYKSKDIIIDLLDYINVILYSNTNNKENMIGILNSIMLIENTKVKLNANCNYDMCIDEVLLKMWEEINEKYNRS